MAQRPATVLQSSKINLLRKALTVAPMTLNLTGFSMFPAVRPGDKCRISAVDPDEIELGDVILTTRDDRLFAHRVVGIKPGPPRQWIIKGDTLLWPDPPVGEDGLLGRLMGVERKGRFVNFLTPKQRRAGRLMAKISGPYSKAFAHGIGMRRRVKAKMADSGAIRRTRKAAAAGEITVHPATEADYGGLAVLFTEQKTLRNPLAGVNMDLMFDQARNMVRGAEATGAKVWVAERDSYVMAHAVIGPLHPDESGAKGWWVMSVYVKASQRGAGAAEAMIRAGIEDARNAGQSELRYAAYGTNAASLRLAEKLGFLPDSSEDAQLFNAYYRRISPNAPRLHVLRCDLNAKTPPA